MGIKLAIIHVDDEKLGGIAEEFQADASQQFENEMEWAKDSGIELGDYYSIPSELEDYHPVEVVWILKQVRDTLQHLKEDGKIEKVTPELEIELIKDLYENHETIDQDIDFRVCDYLGIES
ncbi:hypothetical protein IMZ31_18965 (plasmid) [Pontibacillus sp. ALD_SL1]|uniref:hypothetical protein n=1 Tax=Pontibacillus sp. ALD_SL1 TaxID=2777185 RepID=UPI001A96DFB9|nr:hypothetical protein [Pontibacillus sp. ALD_SL1]QST02631.1 hypothetical protein IMZ31_18965 [Pontibacillus sp. ALD_SL1]